ncbi:disease resistance protein RPV1-like [Prosopis cineraria]|uniref:disease resistance protein RPV1-like n=1 Tax=Prosopis cineraria TaxID=364024 RepID=UPI00240FE6A9|nr:disease resistance protein RPV1-like [Prosopis cineraria]
MASSSSSAPSSGPAKKYDVFISFRGEDTRHNFTSHLHSALHRDQIETYIDYRIEKGDEVWPSLEKAIEDSTLFLVIFSENYASSTWCLKELTKIIECSKNQGHNLVMPVFYRVDPSNVRKQSGSYEQAFEEHDHKGVSKQQLQKWREALTYASNLSGWSCSFERNEADLIKDIVECVIQKMGCMHESEGHLKGLIGIHKRMGAVESLLCKGSQDDVRFVGIWGMGGIGKTTLAKAMFDKLRFFAFEGSCFVSNVREKSKKLGMEALKKKLVWTLLGDKGSRIVDDEIAPYTMWRLSRKKVLIVLDDVDDHEQLESLAGGDVCFGLGSKILITNRNRRVFDVFGMEEDNIYVLEALDFNEALNLFSINVFRNDCADQTLRNLAREVTRYCGGIPLALKVLGSLFFKKRQEEWESELEKLKKLSCPKIHDILKLSFEGLDCEEKGVFLHISCFFKGYKIEDVRILLDSCGYSTTAALRSLKDKALLDTSLGGRIDMHDLLQEMGHQIVRAKSKDPRDRSHLWNSHEISEILSQNKGSETIEALSFNNSEITEEVYLSPQAFCRMPNLKFLDLHGYFGQRIMLNASNGIEFPNRLKLLRWDGCPLNSLSRIFTAESLVKIEMAGSKLTKLWDGVQNLANLREIDLEYSENLIELPDCSRCRCLADVNLDWCSELRSVHPSILTLDSLHRLSLEGCESLTSLTSSTHLKSLGYLSLLDCSRLENFSVTSENCDFELNLYGTAISDELTSSSGHLSKVRKLQLHLSFSSLPYNLLDLSNLRELDIGGCNKLAPILHSIFDRLRSLEVIHLQCCKLFGLPDNISLLSSLRELHLGGTTVETLPGGIKHLLRLQFLTVNSCAWLLSIPELPPSVRRLLASNCKSLETVHLTSTIEDQVVDDDIKVSRYLDFRGCMKLNRESVKAIEAKVLLELNIATPIPRGVLIGYPEAELCKVPECFMYRTNRSSISVDLSSIPQPWDGSFIFCAIVFEFVRFYEIEACCYKDGLCVGGGRASLDCGYLSGKPSKHAFFWRGQVERRIEERIIDAQSGTCHPTLEIKFEPTLEYGDKDEAWEYVEEYGVCPTSALEYQKYIQKMRLKLQPQPDCIGMEAGCSRYSTSHSIMHDEPHTFGMAAGCSRKRKYYNFKDLEDFQDLDSTEN